MKKTNVQRLAPSMLRDIRQNVPWGRSAEFSDEEINGKTNRELLEHFLQWNGISGFTGTILSAVENIYGVKLNK